MYILYKKYIYKNIYIIYLINNFLFLFIFYNNTKKYKIYVYILYKNIYFLINLYIICEYFQKKTNFCFFTITYI